MDDLTTALEARLATAELLLREVHAEAERVLRSAHEEAARIRETAESVTKDLLEGIERVADLLSVEPQEVGSLGS